MNPKEQDRGTPKNGLLSDSRAVLIGQTKRRYRRSPELWLGFSRKSPRPTAAQPSATKAISANAPKRIVRSTSTFMEIGPEKSGGTYAGLRANNKRTRPVGSVSVHACARGMPPVQPSMSFSVR